MLKQENEKDDLRERDDPLRGTWIKEIAQSEQLGGLESVLSNACLKAQG